MVRTFNKVTVSVMMISWQYAFHVLPMLDIHLHTEAVPLPPDPVQAIRQEFLSSMFGVSESQTLGFL